jgi:signal transduction histidine kinase
MTQWWRRWNVDPRLGVGLLLLVLLWLAAAGPAVNDAAELFRNRTTADRLGRAVDTVVVELQQERLLSGGDTSALAGQRVRTDRAITALNTATDGWRGRMITAEAARSVDELRSRLGGLGAVRSQVDTGRTAGHAEIIPAYTRIIQAGLGAPWLPSPSAQTLAALGRAREAFAEEDAVMRGALATPAGVTDADRVRLGELIGARQGRLSDAASSVPGDAAYQRLTAIEEQTLLRRTTPVTVVEWVAAADPANADLRAAEAAAARQMTAATPGAVAAIVYAGLVAGVGLVAVIGVFMLARRLAPARSRREAGTARPAEAAAPAWQALLLDLHRRSQRLVHRQLRLLDAMERRQSDDETLGDLFRVDHLVTLVRRNVEKAIALAGGRPGRRWRRPVSLVEVVRGAAAEINDYGRVSTAQVQAARLAGGAVTDLTHLLAELIDNAAGYSPPETRVRVSGSRDDDGGYTVTIADVGPGMSDLDLEIARKVMSEEDPPADGVWWGFYAVGRFAARQNISVRLGPGPAGGLLAAVQLPGELLTDPGEAGPGPEAPPLSRVARMRARLGEVSDAAATTVDLPKVGIERVQ